MITISIAAVPPSPNRLRRQFRNPHVYRRLRNDWQALLLSALGPHHRTEAKDQARKVKRLPVEIVIAHERMFDPDNLRGSVKPVLDAMKNIGYIGDDSAERIELSVQQVKVPRKDRKTTIKIGIRP